MDSPPPAPYMTLSYRWGASSHIRLLSSNIASFRQGQPIANLPVLFRDIIEVCHHFSVRYLWIDCLCIIQDSKEDWEQESLAMQYVYSNSLCNLAASAAESPDSGLVYDRDLDFIRPGKIQSSLFSNKPRTFYIYDKTYWNRQIFYGPLHNRGWVFQERFLSPSVLYFAKDQLLWECRTNHRCEVFPQGIPSHWSDKAMDSLMEQRLSAQQIQGNRLTLKTFSLWTDLVQQYSRCDLTRPSDKLHAMAGIAKLFEEYTGDEYAAGLWKSCFTAMLDWRVFDATTCYSAGYRAPSWSWASVDSPVHIFGISMGAKILVDLEKLVIQTRTSDKMSAIVSGYAVLKAQVIPVVCRSVRPPFATFQAPTGTFMVKPYLDTMDSKLTDSDKIFYMPLKLGYLSSDDKVMRWVGGSWVFDDVGIDPGKVVEEYRKVVDNTNLRKEIRNQQAYQVSSKAGAQMDFKVELSNIPAFEEYEHVKTCEDFGVTIRHYLSRVGASQPRGVVNSDIYPVIYRLQAFHKGYILQDGQAHDLMSSKTLGNMWDTMNLSNEDRMVHDIHDVVEVYYEITLKSFIRHITQSILEGFVMDKDGPLSKRTSKYVLSLSEEEVSKIAREDKATGELRDRLNSEITKLEEARDVVEAARDEVETMRAM
ncbi:heterokaryon incompatibility [Fusarium longipes]|uniref:Heterokaryon incompatibility n=1 Tax=Fusarium longipes TaxID=694270 RepID=A0A395SZX3_9HYPO|nr:heterokaryon incompatibility [Fusarium longipes]